MEDVHVNMPLVVRGFKFSEHVNPEFVCRSKSVENCIYKVAHLQSIIIFIEQYPVPFKVIFKNIYFFKPLSSLPNIE